MLRNSVVKETALSLSECLTYIFYRRFLLSTRINYPVIFTHNMYLNSKVQTVLKVKPYYQT